MRLASRRAFLRAGVVVATTAAAPVAVARSASALTVRPRATRLRRAMFTPHVGTAFLLSTRGGTSYRAVLVSATGTSDKQFALMFRIAGAARPAAGTFTLRHARMRRVALYVGSVDKPERGLYEAVVSV